LDDNTTTVLLALISAVSALVAAYIAYLAKRGADMAVAQAKTTHELVNSRMTELLALTKSSAHAEGVIEGTTITAIKPSIEPTA